MVESSRPGRILARETLLAVLVLALCFLSFGHRAVAVPDGTTLSAAISWCGDASLPGNADHAACHACRLGQGALLPPPPCATTHFPVAEAVLYAASVPAVLASTAMFAPSARGPPLTV